MAEFRCLIRILFGESLFETVDKIDYGDAAGLAIFAQFQHIQTLFPRLHLGDVGVGPVKAALNFRSRKACVFTHFSKVFQ